MWAGNPRPDVPLSVGCREAPQLLSAWWPWVAPHCLSPSRRMGRLGWPWTQGIECPRGGGRGRGTRGGSSPDLNEIIFKTCKRKRDIFNLCSVQASQGSEEGAGRGPLRGGRGQGPLGRERGSAFLFFTFVPSCGASVKATSRERTVEFITRVIASVPGKDQSSRAPAPAGRRHGGKQEEREKLPGPVSAG